MTSSHRSTLGAMVLFALIALVVLGGLGWATSSSYELAKKTVTEEHDRKVSQAVLDMSSYMAGIINAETSRKYSDYWARYNRKPIAAFNRDALEVDVNHVVLPSPLAESGPTHAWIDLYFLMDATGRLSSPHIADVESPWDMETPSSSIEAERRMRRTWKWLQSVLQTKNLHDEIAQACCAEHEEFSTAPDATPSEPVHAATNPARELDEPSEPFSRPYQLRQRSYRKAQESYLPHPACVDAEIAEKTAARVTDAGTASDDTTGSVDPADSDNVEITTFPITAFWLGEDPIGHQKLAFVREVHWDAAVHYQGFIADWSRLKPDLLRQIQHPFPYADLQPVLDDDDSAVYSAARMANLPVSLKVAEVEGGVSAAAWKEVRGTLVISWIAAGVVLIIAGVGLRNLVALTERRMQFAYAVTHELRTPLTTFRLYADMLAAGLVPNDSKQQYVDTLNRESQRLSSLVEGVLEYARLENQKVKLNATETDASTLLSGITEHLQKQCNEHGVTPATENTLMNGQRVRTDVDVVTRIAGVLVNNACRHARENSDPAVVVRLGGGNGKVYLDVADSGAGVDRADTRAIFKPFRRGRGADKAARGGIGLGLALARNWAILLGGNLELAARHHSTLGGAHFRLTIPTQPPQ